MNVPRGPYVPNHSEPVPPRGCGRLLVLLALLLVVTVLVLLVVSLRHIGAANHPAPLVVVPSTYGPPGPSGGSR